MDKFILRQYNDLVKEIEEDRKRIDRLRGRIERIEAEGSVIDSVKGGEGGIQHFTIEGYPDAEYYRAKTALKLREAKLTDNLNDCIDLLDDLTDFINNVDDSHIRRILKLRFLDGLSWLQVSIRMGGDNTEDSVRMAAQRYIGSEE